MKKCIFGALVTLIGLTFTAVFFLWAAMNPWNYNGITGILGSLLGTGLLFLVLLSALVMAAGLAICWREAYRKD